MRTTVKLQLPRGPEIVLDAPEEFITPKLLKKRGGLAEHDGETFACALACASDADSGAAFYDIGANVGLFSLLVAGSLNMPTHAFEPTPAVADFLEATVQGHKLPISVHRMALSDAAGMANFYLSQRSDASNSLSRRFRRSRNAIQVPVNTLDAVAADRPALIKIDVETAEPQVLRGALTTIDRWRPPIIMEILNPKIAAEVNALFDGRGYSVYHITTKGTWRRHQQVPDAWDEQVRNWLFTPKALDNGFWLKLDAWRWRLRNPTVWSEKARYWILNPKPLADYWTKLDARRWRIQRT